MTDHPDVEAEPVAKAPTFQVALLDENGLLKYRGFVSPLIGGDRPKSIRTDGQTYVATGNAPELVDTQDPHSSRYVYVRDLPSAFICSSKEGRTS